jgi:phosphoglycolate phosphatase
LTAPVAVRGVVFDLDGTLVDGYEGITTSVNAARAHFGLPPLEAADVRGRVGAGLSNLMDDVLGPARSAEGATVFRAVYDDVCDTQTRPAPELAATLAALRGRGLRLSVASNKPVGYSRRILQHLEVLPYFDLVAGPETAGRVKPDPAMILACLTAMGVAASEAIYVGDMAIDAEAGRRAGVAVVLVAGGSDTHETLRGTGCTVLAGLPDLPGWLP